MRAGIVEVLSAEEVNNFLESEFEKEVSTLEIKRELVPTIDDAALGAKRLIEDTACDFVVIGYALEEGEKLSQAFENSILHAQFTLKKNIFRVIVPHDKKTEDYAREAAKEIIRYFYKPHELQHERSTMAEGQETDSSFNPFAMFG
ncbi:MAG: hypothetical protein KAW41_03360 [Candidatus Diapherotrites archaeon]|nr:hypothetical protein [Candidatus Diapherotrites archaeon]